MVNVGIDGGKHQLDVCIHECELSFTVTNNQNGIRTLVRRLARYRLERVAVEATGRRESSLVIAVVERGFPVIICQPNRVRRYAGAKGILAKTDNIDARVLADYAAVMTPEGRPISSGNIRKLKDLSVRRRQLIDMRTMEINRLDVMPKELLAGISQLTRQFDKHIAKLDALIAQLIEEVDEWRDQRDRLLTVPGVGP